MESAIDKVHIPDNFDDSEESETLSEKLRSIGAFTSDGQCSKQTEDAESQQVWQMVIDQRTAANEDRQNAWLLEQAKKGTKTLDTSKSGPENLTPMGDQEGSQELIINSQESVVTVVNVGDKVQLGSMDIPLDDPGMAKDSQPERRSERLKKDVHVTTKQKNEAYAKKRSLEGNTRTSCSFSSLENVHLNDLAKNMGVMIPDNNFATFDIIKDLENARNCLNKHQKKAVNDIPCESVSFDPENKLLQLNLVMRMRWNLRRLFFKDL